MHRGHPTLPRCWVQENRAAGSQQANRFALKGGKLAYFPLPTENTCTLGRTEHAYLPGERKEASFARTGFRLMCMACLTDAYSYKVKSQPALSCRFIFLPPCAGIPFFIDILTKSRCAKIVDSILKLSCLYNLMCTLVFWL